MTQPDDAPTHAQATLGQTRCPRWASRLEWLQGIEAVQPLLALLMKGLRLLGRLLHALLA